MAYVIEAVGLLAACAPKLRLAASAGYAFVALDGALVLIDRVAADRPFYPASAASKGCL